MKTRPITKKVFQDLCEVIPGGVNSPVRACISVGQLPLVAARAEGDLIYDVDGHAYIDYCGSWGALIHGHVFPPIINKACERMQLGSSFGVTTAIEEALARRIIEFLPSIEKIRFVSSGTEATMTAIRLARGYTKRSLLIKFEGNYHGHADFLLVNAGSGVSKIASSTSAGIPDDIVKNTLCIPFNDFDAVKQLFREKGSQIAALILEPVGGNMGVIPPQPGFLELLREETARHGAVLIFDEVMTGFRVHKNGAQGLYGIKPDMTCVGKVMGGGFPTAGVGGRSDIMDCIAPLGPVYQAGTLSGNPVAMEAGLQSLNYLDVPGFYEELERKTKVITEPVNVYLKKNNIPACIQEAGSMLTLFFGKTVVNNFHEAKACDMELFAKFFRYMFENGVYIPPLQVEPWFLSNAHTEAHLIKTRDLIIQFFHETTDGHR